MTDSLHILFGPQVIGRLDYHRKKDAISLSYEESWQFSPEGFPASLSLPLAKRVHGDERIRPFLQGLLPDNPAVLEAWGKRFQVSPRNPFDLIKHVGEDCAGALQFVRPERLDLILSGALDALIPLSEADLEKRFQDLGDQARSIPMQIEGRFSLAGAQTKDALHLKEGKWFVPSGRFPSTHILKPELEDFDHHAINEHFCLQLASKVGIIRAESSILTIAGKRVLCVKRYDRLADGQGGIRRIHQEDFCQATGCFPNQKYQADGGPSAAGIVRLLNDYSDDPFDDVARFIMGLAFNWVVAGTDAHSKNYSILHDRGSVLRLAPLYDLASYLPYQRDANSTKVKLAMKIGGSYRLHEIDAKHWRKWSEEADVPHAFMSAYVVTLIDGILRSLDETRASVGGSGDPEFLDRLVKLIALRAQSCAETFD